MNISSVLRFLVYPNAPLLEVSVYTFHIFMDDSKIIYIVILGYVTNIDDCH